MVSPFSAVLRSNYAASSTEVPQIEQIVIQHDKDIAQIDEEIVPAKSKLDCLQHRRAELISVQQSHKALISPRRRTPPEIWAGIFLLCLPADGLVRINVLQAPLLLVQICSWWREITLSTPRLWNSICLDDSGGADIV
jgi:hypothetical protein